jgi:hypothetical protein
MRISRKTAALSVTLVAVVAFVLIDAREEKPSARAAPAAPAAAASALTSAPGAQLKSGPGGQPKAEPQPQPQSQPQSQSQASQPQPQQQALKLPERGGLAEPGSPLFSSQSWQPPPPKFVAPPPPKPIAPVAPPLPFRFVGRMLQDGHLFVFLAKGDTVVTVKQGDTIDGVYRVESIGETEVALTYLPLREKQTLAVVTSLPAALGVPGAATSPRPPAAVSSGPAVPPAQARTGATLGVPRENVVAP